MKKKLLGILLGIGVMLTASGCGTDLQEFAKNTYPQAIQDRVNANIDIARKFNDLGALSDKTLASLEKHMQDQANKYKKSDDKTASLLGSAVSEVRVLGDDLPSYVTVIYEGISYDIYKGVPISIGAIPEQAYDFFWDIAVPSNFDKDPAFGTEKKSNELNLSHFVISNYLAATKFNSITFARNTWYPRDAADVKPIELVSKDVKDELNKNLKAQIYILRPEIATMDGMSSVDGIINMVQQACQGDDINTEMLNNYFCAAVDSNNEPLYLIDLDDDSYNLIDVSESNDGSKNEPGYDLILSQYDEEVLKVRFTEFNAEAFDKLNALIGLNPDKYKFAHSGKTDWRVYLMEYPVSVIDSFEENADGDIDVTFEKSGLGINLFTGQFVKYETDSNGEFLPAGKVITSDDYYLTTHGAQNNNEVGVSSLILKGLTTVTVQNTSDEDLEFYCGRIILRDYLEASFAPEFVSDENMVVFGRKIRFNFSKGTWTEQKNFAGTKSQFDLTLPKDDEVASYVDKDGLNVVTSQQLRVTDFCDINELMKDSYSDCKVVTIAENGQTPGSLDAKDVTGTPQINELARKTVGSGTKIKPTHYFPSEDIGADDFSTDDASKQRFYCIATKKNLFESGLYAEWINSTSTTASLTWWNQYLADNGFIYTVGKEALQEYLASEYAYELSQNGAIILDLDVVSDIQDMYDHDNIINRTSLIRTFFMFLGWVLIVYATMLMLCWALDANADIGIKLLNKATMGHWVAVKYEDDIPYQNTNDLTYITFGKLITKCLIIMGTGLLLIYVNVFTVVLYLIDLLGSFASEVEKIIQGIR